MPFDGNGNWTRTNGVTNGPTIWQTAAVTSGGIIDSAQHDAEGNDNASGFEAVLPRDGQGPGMTGDLKMNGNEVVMGQGQVNDASRIDINSNSGIAQKIRSTAAPGAAGPRSTEARNSAVPVNGQLGRIRDSAGFNSALAEVSFFDQTTEFLDVTAGAHIGREIFSAADGSGGTVPAGYLGATGWQDTNGRLMQSLKSAQLTRVNPSGTALAEFAVASADATRIEIELADVSHGEGSPAGLQLQLSSGALYETSGYEFVISSLQAASLTTTPTTVGSSFNIVNTVPSSGQLTGIIRLKKLQGNNRWILASDVGDVINPENGRTAGNIILPGIIDAFKLVWSGGINFDNGAVSATVE